MTATVSSNGLYTAEWEIVTPEIAAERLANQNVVNRKLRFWHVQELEDDMNDGFWMVNGDTVVHDTNDQIADGQHRYAAIVESGQAQELLVVRGVDPSARPTIDDNLKRRFRDDLAMNGIKNSTLRENMLRMIVKWDRYGGLADMHYRPTRKFLTDRYEIYGPDLDIAIPGAHRFWSRYPGNRNAMMFTWWLLVVRLGMDRERVDRFFSILTIGSQDDEDVALVRLRERITRPISYGIGGQEIRMAASVEVYWLIQGWNRWVTGSRRGYATPAEGITDPYPEIHKPEVTA